MTSFIMQKDLNKLIKKNQKKSFLADSGEVQNRQVETLMLQIDWIFVECLGKKKAGNFADFVVALSKAPHESLFSTSLVTTLIHHFWDRYYRVVILKCFLPFLVYLIVTLIYISTYALVGIKEEDRYVFSVELCLRITMGILMLYFFSFECRCILRDGLAYFVDIFNYIDLVSFMLNIYIIERAISGDTHSHKATEDN